jgi:hypothetical protein
MLRHGFISSRRRPILRVAWADRWERHTAGATTGRLEQLWELGTLDAGASASLRMEVVPEPPRPSPEVRDPRRGGGEQRRGKYRRRLRVCDLRPMIISHGFSAAQPPLDRFASR